MKRAKRSDVAWMIGIIFERRAKSFEVAHAVVKGKILCGRSRTVKWAGYKRAKIARFVKASAYERHCRRCLDVLHPPRPRRTVRK